MATEFDTLEAAKDLEKAGFERDQAEALANAMRRSGRARIGHLASKADLYQVAIGIVVANVGLTTALVKLL